MGWSELSWIGFAGEVIKLGLTKKRQNPYRIELHQFIIARPRFLVSKIQEFYESEQWQKRWRNGKIKQYGNKSKDNRQRDALFRSAPLCRSMREEYLFYGEKRCRVSRHP